jgi:hypothetical protein
MNKLIESPKYSALLRVSPVGQANGQSKPQAFTVFDLLVTHVKYSN